ncbi:MAG: hypothetical protein LKJ25_08745 [Clostridia bacterium]|jgi:uncharacterized Zn finger protein (UPF0148 family)|nr:hypothetical protein [Clostridia bacterium]
MIKCPVCGQYEFEHENDFDICPVCNWENDGLQIEKPDETECANKMSLNQARKAWQNGEKVL